MNYLSHAHVALGLDSRAAFLLGAMLPDFASMCASRIDTITEPLMAAGEIHHQEVDVVFHAHPSFVQLQADGSAALRERGLPRGSAVAAAHVAIELFLDGSLLANGDHAALEEAYLGVLDAAAPDDLAPHIRWRRPEHIGNFERLRAFLLERGMPVGYRDPDFVGTRVAAALSRRPRFALDDQQRESLKHWARSAQPRILEAAGEIFTTVKAAVTGA